MEKKYDVLAIGELNVDLILTGMATLPIPGREIIADNCALTMGSSTAICAAGIAKLGLKTGFVGKVGDDSYGRVASDALRGYGVDLQNLIVDPSIDTGITCLWRRETIPTAHCLPILAR
ncbi:MAG: carbohydrate kinase family protein [Clostridia bacterium]|nr:carbohydrate kinase family protein [Clostridia bacterium]